MVRETTPALYLKIKDKSDCLVRTLYKQYRLDPNYNYRVQGSDGVSFYLRYDFPEFDFLISHQAVSYTLTPQTKDPSYFDTYFDILYTLVIKFEVEGHKCMKYDHFNASERRWLLINAEKIKRKFPGKYKVLETLPFCEDIRSLFRD